MVSEELQNIRKSYGERVTVDLSKDGDILKGKLTANGDIENEISIPLEQVEKKEQKKFLSKKGGDTITFNLTKAIKEPAYRTRLLGKTEEELEGIEVSEVTFEVEEVNRLEPAELNQEFYDKLFGEGNVKDQKELEEKIKEYLSNSFDRESENFLAHNIRKELLKSTKMDLPDEFLKKWLLVSNEGKVKEEDIDNEYQGYADEMKWNLILNRVSEDHEIQVENDEVVSKAKELIVAQLAQSGLGDQMADQLDIFADNYLKANEGQNYLQVFNQVRNEKILEFIREKIKITNKEVSLEQFKKEVDK